MWRMTGSATNRSAREGLRQSRKGQVMLEFSVAIIGAVVFFYVLLKCWTWMNVMLIEPQVQLSAFETYMRRDGSYDAGR